MHSHDKKCIYSDFMKSIPALPLLHHKKRTNNNLENEGRDRV